MFNKVTKASPPYYSSVSSESTRLEAEEGRAAGSKKICDQCKLKETQKQVDEVVKVMQNNVEKLYARDMKLTELDERSEMLLNNASKFEKETNELKRKAWFKDKKMLIIMVVIAIIAIFIIWILIFIF